MEIKIFTELDINLKNKINDFHEQNSKSNFFQSLKAFNFFYDTLNYDPYLLVAIENDRIVGTLLANLIREEGLLKGFFSRRCIIEGGPVVESQNEEVIEVLLRKLDELVSSQAIYTEFRNFFDQSDNDGVFKSAGYNFTEHFNFIVKTEEFEVTRRNLSSSRKREINKSKKNGAQIIDPESIHQVQEFYAILSNLYAEKVKKPLPEYDFFKKFYEDKDLGKYFFIEFEDKIVGGIMCPIYKHTIYEWYVCGKDHEYENIYPSVLATWAPMAYASDNDLEYFDFLGAGKPDEDYGVREFKSRFGGELLNYGRYTKINNLFLYKIGEFGVKILY